MNYIAISRNSYSSKIGSEDISTVGTSITGAINNLDKPRSEIVTSIPANTYSTFADALNSLYSIVAAKSFPASSSLLTIGINKMQISAVQSNSFVQYSATKMYSDNIGWSLRTMFVHLEASGVNYIQGQIYSNQSLVVTDISQNAQNQAITVMTLH